MEVRLGGHSDDDDDDDDRADPLSFIPDPDEIYGKRSSDLSEEEEESSDEEG